MQIARLIAEESDRDFIWSAYSSAYQKVVERQFGAWEVKPQKLAFDEKWHQGGFEIIALNGTYVGAVWITNEEGFIQLRDIFLAPEYQGQGIGTQVVREELEKARAAGMPLRLRVLKQSHAIALYERLGFTRCGETATQYWMEAV
ncbi:GNAT family N-acetyltransferase [Vreelandella zhanjiangensis]|uniref:GNAT family N-acetyltransferase n=1 Tax=Vreelandella zhanjiangensis TaxID=1121960 RepID=UPI0003614F5D|nr:GNAT family N-acetyltransferase [Halomonas zhanjiangensis]